MSHALNEHIEVKAEILLNNDCKYICLNKSHIDPNFTEVYF